MEDKVILSQEGYDKLKDELKYLLKTKRPEASEAMKAARAHGDLSENAEFDAAKNEQAIVEARIADLQEKLANARIIDESQMSTDQVFIGAKVTLFDCEFDEEIEYWIVGAEEADLAKNKISINSAVAKALLGKKVGDVVDAKIPAGTVQYKILKIER